MCMFVVGLNQFCMCMYMNVCIYTLFVCMCISIYIEIHTHICVRIFIYTYVCIFVYTCVFMCVCVTTDMPEPISSTTPIRPELNALFANINENLPVVDFGNASTLPDFDGIDKYVHTYVFI